MSLQFHSYVTLRNRAVASKDERARTFAKSMNSAEYRAELLRRAVVRWGKAATNDQRLHVMNDRSPAAAEQEWAELHRPYYNVWPIAVELSQTVKLDLCFRDIAHPFPVVLVRFARNHELAGNLGTALVQWEPPLSDGSAYVRLHCLFQTFTGNATLQFRFRPTDTVEVWLTKMAAERRAYESPGDELTAPGFKLLDQVSGDLIRLVVFIGLLAKGMDLVTPVVLAKDQAKYDGTDDAALKLWLERRAARRGGGRGFDVCKKLDMDRSQSPHWRSPHLALFWVGEGRTRPVIKLRSGSVVLRASMDQVPTGWLGPETATDDLPAGEGITGQQLPIPKSQRFRILKRDGYKCQICGRSPKDRDAVKLHVDHRVARARGGSNLDENLWCLCSDCNSGKSDDPL